MSKAAATKQATPFGPHDRPQHGLLDAATVAHGDDVRREDVEQALEVARLDRPLEGLEDSSGLGRRNDPARSARGDVCPRSVSDLADR
jgi:hypothetical protein